jgi:urease accessory protein
MHCQAAPFALAAVHWKIGLEDCLLGYAWGWTENQVAAAIKLVPLGQTDGQRVQLKLAERLPATVARAMKVEDDDIGAGAPALAIASACHETQYTRLFRS